ncbi:MAG: hypothetical protein ABSH20_19050 [Tepidisphaeraceae bacterium]|jgi:hypothetical protein
MTRLALATSILALLLSVLFWLYGPDRSVNSVNRQQIMVLRDSARFVRPDTFPVLPPLQKQIPEVDLREVPLEDAVERLRRVTGLNVVVQWGVIEKLGLDPSTPITLKLCDVSAVAAARAMLRPRISSAARPICLVDENILILTAALDSEEFTETHAYDVRDIIMNAIAYQARIPATTRPGIDSGARNGSWRGSVTSCFDEASTVLAIAEALKQIGRESWVDNGGKTGQINYFAGRFVITATPEMHDEIGRLLAELRKGK